MLQRIKGAELSSETAMDTLSGFVSISSLRYPTCATCIFSRLRAIPASLRSSSFLRRDISKQTSLLMPLIMAARSKVSCSLFTTTIRSSLLENGLCTPSAKIGGAMNMSLLLSATLVSSGYFSDRPFTDNWICGSNRLQVWFVCCSQSLMLLGGIGTDSIKNRCKE